MRGDRGAKARTCERRQGRTTSTAIRSDGASVSDADRSRILVVLLGAIFMSLVGVSIRNVALPAVQQGLGAPRLLNLQSVGTIQQYFRGDERGRASGYVGTVSALVAVGSSSVP